MPLLLVTWGFLIFVVCLFVAAANGYRNLWLHLHWPIHKQRMARAALCVEAAGHWHDPYITRQFIDQAYQLCEDCGCPADVWPAAVLKLYAGSWV